MGMVYRWREGSRFGADPDEVGVEIDRVRDRNGGLVSADLMVQYGRRTKGVWHQLLEWDDQKAGHEHRLSQARTIIGALQVIKMTGGGEPKVIRAYVNIRRGEERAYTSINDAMRDADLREQVVQQALRELESWRVRYKEYNELAQVMAAIDAAAPKPIAQRERAEVREGAAAPG